MALGGAALILGMVIGLLILIILALVFWVMMLVNVATAKNKGDWKLVWIIIVVLLGVIGAIIYYFIGKKERKG